jgi:hypothetical protein
VRFLPTFVDDARHAWKMLSVWAFALIAIAPDLHTAVVAMGWLDDPTVPASFVWTLRGLAVLGIVSRLIQQKAKPAA